MNDRKMCVYLFESGYICGTTASVLADDNKWYCEGHAKSITPPNTACTRRAKVAPKSRSKNSKGSAKPARG